MAHRGKTGCQVLRTRCGLKYKLSIQLSIVNLTSNVGHYFTFKLDQIDLSHVKTDFLKLSTVFFAKR